MKNFILPFASFLLLGTVSSYGMDHPSQNIIMDDEQQEEKKEKSTNENLQLLERKQRMERQRVMERVDAVRNAEGARDYFPLNAHEKPLDEHDQKKCTRETMPKKHFKMSSSKGQERLQKIPTMNTQGSV